MNNKILHKALRIVEAMENLEGETFGFTKITLAEFEQALKLDSPGAVRDKVLYDAQWTTSYWAGRPRDLAAHFRTIANEHWEMTADLSKIALKNFADILDQRPDGLIGLIDKDWDAPIEFTITDEALDALVAHYLEKIRGAENVPDLDEAVYPEGEHFSHESLVGNTLEAEAEATSMNTFTAKVKIEALIEFEVTADSADEAYKKADAMIDNATNLSALGEMTEVNVIEVDVE